MLPLYHALRFIYIFTPWLVEASAYALLVPFVVGPEPFTGQSRILVFTVVLIVGSYYDRKLWQAHTNARAEKKPSLQGGQVVFPVLFYLLAGLVFNLVSLLALPKLLVVAIIISIAKYLWFEIQFTHLK